MNKLTGAWFLHLFLAGSFALFNPLFEADLTYCALANLALSLVFYIGDVFVSDYEKWRKRRGR